MIFRFLKSCWRCHYKVGGPRTSADNPIRLHLQFDLYQIGNFRCYADRQVHISCRETERKASPAFPSSNGVAFEIEAINFENLLALCAERKQPTHILYPYAVQLMPATKWNKVINFSANDSEWFRNFMISSVIHETGEWKKSSSTSARKQTNPFLICFSPIPRMLRDSSEEKNQSSSPQK